MSEWLRAVTQATVHAGEDIDKGETPSLLEGMQTCTVAMEVNMQVFPKLRSHSTTRPSIYPKDTISYCKDTCSTMFIVILFIIAETGNNLDVPGIKNE